MDPPTDEQAWGIFVKRYGPFVWRLLKRFKSLTHEERRDRSQEVFKILLDGALEQFHLSTDHEFRSYLWTITDNRAKDYLRKHSRRFEILDSQLPVHEDDDLENSVGVEAAIDPSPGPEQLFAAREVRQQILGCLAQIPHIDQEVFWLKLRERPHEEISEILKIPPGTVASKYDRAKEKIIACLRRAGVLS